MSYPVLRDRPRKSAKLLCLISVHLLIAAVAWADLPAGWTDADIGGPGSPGSAGYTNGNWTVSGGGLDIWDTADHFNYAYTTVGGDGIMIARVTSLQNSDPGSGWSKAGLMYRNDSTAGSVNMDSVSANSKATSLFG